ncbi:tyrosine-type recombinase/integrase [Microbacterium dauci]|uniref:Tyrosine-type recombinase/integrase n=1 Tax=Microbacterium dauci TaxID=3048008 RepID=A0ABT6ZAK8_9MICO|nr:tyrosine-type recombinase/integrase [Microbacterium sp. LX3-4]MDJ1113200.1 tyrosine-type recombinase/integrase [Microbacterium sp. LX3-4]
MSGTISKYETKDGPRYRVQYRKPDKSVTGKRGFKTKKEASLYLASVTITKATGEYVDPSLGRRTVSVFATQWERSHLPTLKPSSQEGMRSSYRTHVEPKWGGRSVAGIRPSELEDWVGELSGQRAAQTVRRAAFVLNQILAIAERDRVIPRNPMAGVKLPKKKRKPQRYLTHDQVETIAAGAAHPNLVRFLAYTGLRWGEAVELQVGDLNMLRRRLTVERNAVYVRGQYVVGTPKTGERREVAMPHFLVGDLARACEGKPRSGFVFGDGGAQLPYPHATSGWFQAAVKAAQLIDATIPRVTPHDLRHTAASLAIQAGANVKAVQRMLGHSSAAMTLDVYADLFDEDLDTVAEAMSAARAKSVS